MDMNIVWTKMLEQIKETTSPALYGYWFEKTKFIKENGDVLIIQITNWKYLYFRILFTRRTRS